MPRKYTVSDKVKAANRRKARLGGLALFQKYGPDYMEKLGRKGGQKTWEKYTLQPVGQSQYALVDRETNKIVKIIYDNRR